jgi:hypothetical protein
MNGVGNCNIENVLGVCWGVRKRLWDLNMIHTLSTKHIVHIIRTKCKCS